ncbi:MAG: molecular chaperone DnaJ [Gammaproteobacteria bacterium]|nr:molecular chaperone DnaJ [Gammaproteobacteria bacterium]OUT97224.1 MAG: molecular chaperone DnaJ [Gammaproteobacteria bacterium TMED36]|tara:strand:+ start:369 stop:1505 length:1137 start_codon:yes stop_codon:yes gene_type:complete
MSEQDLYQTLGIEKNSSDADIKKAYRKLAMKYHPDRNPDDSAAEQKFKSIQKAYAVLSDKQKRAAYDQFGHAGVNQQGGMGGGFNTGDAFNDIFGDVFGDIFGGGRGQARRSSAQRGSDLRYQVNLTLEQAVFGDKINVEIPSYNQCDTCTGSGAKEGTSAIRCIKCDGRGAIRVQQGFFTLQQTCPECRGSGETIKDPCSICSGSGRKRSNRTIAIKIPAGVDNADRIRLSGEGEAGIKGGPSGDLYVDVTIKKHDIFEREGNHLICTIPISFGKAVLGGTVEVPTIDGAVNLSVPSETQSGKTFRLKGKGIKSYRENFYGDLYCTVQVETPVSLTDEQKEILRQFDKSVNNSNTDHRPNKKTWTDSVSEFFKRISE